MVSQHRLKKQSVNQIQTTFFWRYEHAHKGTVKKTHKKISKRHTTFLGDLSRKARLMQQLTQIERTVLKSRESSKSTEKRGVISFQITLVELTSWYECQC